MCSLGTEEIIMQILKAKSHTCLDIILAGK